MNIKTVTCHDVYNYGASLQAYALLYFLENQGHNVEIIVYLPVYIEGKYDYKLENKGLFGKLAYFIPILTPLWARLRYRKLWKFTGRKKAFDEFKNKYLKLTQIRYHELNDFINNPISADCFIAGSDQIWNPRYGNGTDPVYYCGFANHQTRCISYAASFGISSLSDEEKKIISPLLKNFDAISIREKTGTKLAESMGFKATDVCDPVFLLSAKEWESICKKQIKKKYLLLYDFNNDNPKLKKISQQIAKEKGLIIISINDGMTIPYADVNINNAGPIEFIEYIRNAEFVIASSFHATAFSIIFHRNFYSFPLLGHKNNSRMEDLLNLTGLENRFDPNTINLDPINYSIVDSKIQPLISFSKNWLTQNLQK